MGATRATGGAGSNQSPPAVRRRDASFTLRFGDDLVPAVKAGRFLITAKQEIDGVDTGGYLRDATREFEVRAPQFVLSPDMVHATNPAPEEAGALAMTLPHVTLSGHLLPWLRDIDPRWVGTGPVTPRAPWLALLVFAAEELPGDLSAVGEVDRMPIGQLLWPTSPEPGVLVPDIPRTQVEVAHSTECDTIRIPGPVFTAVCPRHDELRHLAHVRTVRADTRLRGEELAAGDFSVIVANRLPNPAAGRHVAHLVSLEGCQAALNTVTAQDPQPPDVRVVSLHHWSFECYPADAAGFAVRVHDLLHDDADDGKARDLLLRRPVPAPSADPAVSRARERIEEGWVPLPYQVASGEQTYAWYRGPFTPTVAQPLTRPPEDGWTEAGQLLGYDPEWGVYDTGWAAAWTLGRALALADDDFGAGLSAWRSRARYRSAVIAQRLAAAGSDAVTAELTRRARPRVNDRALRALAGTGAAERLIRALNDPPTERCARTAPDQPAPVPLAVHRVLAESRVQSVLREELREALDTGGEQVAAWFARLRLLYDVPFAQLVPDEAMLPRESLRFFHVDPGWLTALQAGAESLGVTGTADVHLAALAAPWTDRTRNPDDSWPRAGLLIRSALTRECPELIVRGWQNRVPVGLLRRSLLEDDVLLLLFDRVPDEVELSEPPEGLSFGVDPHPRDGVPVLNLRSLGDAGVPTGATLRDVYFPQDPGEAGIDAYLRDDAFGRRVLDLRPDDDGLVRALGARLTEAGQPGEPSPAVLALQLVNAPFRQMILSNLATGGSPS
ncbi:hypothetical protein ACIGXM_11820 [Kitasatospora sp. NPDC052896]|uniref:hypothetical protein n=1 Tax=Kitasatospora sp. NPDC052896 TaxID=3364061 RepID=UPI0037CC519B